MLRYGRRYKPVLGSSPLLMLGCSPLLMLGMLLMLLREGMAQDSSCAGNAPCMVWYSCPSALSLYENRDPKFYTHLQGNFCGWFDRRNTLVCCEAAISQPQAAAPLASAPAQQAAILSPPAQQAAILSPPAQQAAILPSSCGASSTQVRIFGGTAVPMGAFPWMALLGYSFPGGSGVTWSCGGVLITPRYVITAAHCVVEDARGRRRPVVRVRLGEHNVKTQEDCQTTSLGKTCSPGVQDFRLEMVVPHESYTSRGLVSDDIALIRLDRPARLNSNVQPICVPDSSFDVLSFVGNRKAIVAGWGVTETGSKSDVLLQAQVSVKPLDNCKTSYMAQGTIVEGQLCIGGDGPQDSCTGDSGGPVFISSPTGPPFTLLGLVSFGSKEGCGIVGVPAVYTNVAFYRNWIIKNIKV